MGHFKPLFGSGTSDPAKILPLKVWDLPGYLSGSALWNFALNPWPVSVFLGVWLGQQLKAGKSLDLDGYKNEK